MNLLRLCKYKRLISYVHMVPPLSVFQQESWVQSWTKSWRQNQSPCCADYFNEYEAGTIGPDGSVKLPDSW